MLMQQRTSMVKLERGGVYTQSFEICYTYYNLMYYQNAFFQTKQIRLHAFFFKKTYNY